MASKRGHYLISLFILFAFFSLLAANSMASTNILWLQEGQTINSMTITNGIAKIHTIKLLDVSGEESRMCGFLVGNSTLWVGEHQDAETNGMRIYVREIVRVHEQLKDKDVCKVIIGGAILKTIAEENKSTAVSNYSNISSENQTILNQLWENKTETADDEKNTYPNSAEGQVSAEAESKTFISRILNWLKKLFI